MRPPIWQLVKDAVLELGGKASYSAIKQQVWSQYPDVNASTLMAKDDKVFCVVLPSNITEKLRYAATQVLQVQLMEYELRLSFKPVCLS